MKKWIKDTIALIVGSIVGGILYRMGGAAGFNTKFRDFGIPTVQTGVFLFFVYPNFDWTLLALVLCWGATFGAQTTYFKKKGTDAKWYNWLLVGLAYSICWCPIVIAQAIWPPATLHTHWLGFGIRTFVCTGLTIMASELIGKDVIEENVRGIIEVLTLPILFI